MAAVGVPHIIITIVNPFSLSEPCDEENASESWPDVNRKALESPRYVTGMPALAVDAMSVLTQGQDVIDRPRTTSASTSVNGPWQITATG